MMNLAGYWLVGHICDPSTEETKAEGLDHPGKQRQILDTELGGGRWGREEGRERKKGRSGERQSVGEKDGDPFK